MSEDRTDIERGSEIISRLVEVMPDKADESIQALYDDIQKTLRVPFVNFIFRALANYPSFLVPAWSALSPYLRTQKMENRGDALRSDALLEHIPESAAADWATLGDMARIGPFTDTIHYVLPKLLLVATAFDRALATEQLGRGSHDAGDRQIPAPKIPSEIAPRTMQVSMVDAEAADHRLQVLFNDIKRRHGHPRVASYYRALANWPDFLEEAWKRVRTMIAKPAYEERKRVLLEEASNAIDDLVPQSFFSLAESISEEQCTEIRSILAVFRCRLIPDLLLDVSLVKAMLDGPRAARLSRFSFHGRELQS